MQADTLGWIDYLEEMEEPVFHIREFIPSTQYFFHEDWQMEMVARMCPRLEKLLFIHHPKVTRHSVSRTYDRPRSAAPPWRPWPHSPA